MKINGSFVLLNVKLINYFGAKYAELDKYIGYYYKAFYMTWGLLISLVSLGKFKENILFVTFSKKPKLMIIGERLFEHYGYQVPKFQSDEDAVNKLGFLLKKILEGSPMLLVLDDVWPGSESLVEKFKFQILDYKILVTSRVAFPRFGTPLILKPLVHEEAITLLNHFALLEKNSSNVPDEDIVQKVLVFTF